MASAAKRSDTILVHELLAFVQNKLDVMDELSLEQICSSSYTEAEITAARKYLAETAAITSVRLASRRTEGSGKKNLQDIFRAFKETDPDDVPTYVARDLSKLPPVTFDHVDVTSLLKDIQLLKSNITEIRAKLEASERVSAELQREVTSLRNADAAASVVSPPRKRVRHRQSDTSQLSATNMTATDPVPIQVVNLSDKYVKLAGEITKPLSPAVPELVPDVPVIQDTTQESARPARRRRRRRRQPPRSAHREIAHSTAAPPATNARPSSKRMVDGDGFVLVERKSRHRTAPRNAYGTAPPGSTLQPAVPTTLLYVSRLSFQTKEIDVQQYVLKKTLWRVRVVGLGSRHDDFKSFVVRVPTKDLATFMDTSFWPSGVVFRRFRGRLQNTADDKARDVQKEG